MEMSTKQQIISWALLAFSIIFNVVANLVVKNVINNISGFSLDSFAQAGDSIGRLVSNPVGIAGLLSMYLGASFWMLTISRMDVSTAFPLSMSLNILLIGLGGILMLGEALTMDKAIGYALILGSIYFLAK